MERPKVDIMSVKKLIELYTQAMEFYEMKGSDKHVVFLSKLQTLLIKPNVVEAMTNEAGGRSAFEVEIDKDRRMGEFLKRMNAGAPNHKQDAGNLMRTHEELKLTVKAILAASFQDQREAMIKKLEERKKFVMKRDSKSPTNYDEFDRPTRRRGNSREAEDSLHKRRRSRAEAQSLINAVFQAAEENHTPKKVNLKAAMQLALAEENEQENDSGDSQKNSKIATPSAFTEKLTAEDLGLAQDEKPQVIVDSFQEIPEGQDQPVESGEKEPANEGPQESENQTTVEQPESQQNDVVKEEVQETQEKEESKEVAEESTKNQTEEHHHHTEVPEKSENQVVEQAEQADNAENQQTQVEQGGNIEEPVIESNKVEENQAVEQVEQTDNAENQQAQVEQGGNVVEPVAESNKVEENQAEAEENLAKDDFQHNVSEQKESQPENAEVLPGTDNDQQIEVEQQPEKVENGAEGVQSNEQQQPENSNVEENQPEKTEEIIQPNEEEKIAYENANPVEETTKTQEATENTPSVEQEQATSTNEPETQAKIDHSAEEGENKIEPTHIEATHSVEQEQVTSTNEPETQTHAEKPAEEEEKKIEPTNIEAKLDEVHELPEHPQRTSIGGGRASIRNRRESESLEEAKRKLIETIDAENAQQIEELRLRLTAEKESKIEEIKANYAAQRADIDAEPTPAMIKKKLLQKIDKEEAEELQKFEDEVEANNMKEIQKLKQRQKQQKLFKISQISV